MMLNKRGFYSILFYSRIIMNKISNETKNWSLCFMCQKKKNGDKNSNAPHSTVDGIKTLSSNNIVEIYKYGGRLDLDINRISTEMIEGEQPNVETTTLTQNSAKYHHNCSSKYKKRSVESAKIAYEKRKRKNPCRSSRPIHETKKSSRFGHGIVSMLYLRCCREGRRQKSSCGGNVALE